MSMAIGLLFSTALNGQSKERPELAATSIPLTAKLPVIAARDGADVVRRLFEPLGYMVRVESLPLDEQFPDWGGLGTTPLKVAPAVRLFALLALLSVPILG